MRNHLALAALVLIVCAYARGADGEATYRVRLFWRSVPPAIEIAPLSPFSPARAPRLRLEDGGEAQLRKPLTLRARESSLLAGTRYAARKTRIRFSGDLQLRVPEGQWGILHGILDVWAADGELYLEAELPREEYVKAVLSGEASGLKQPEALRAIAVAIRSFAFANSNRHKSEGFDFCDTTHCQDLRLVARRPELDHAVDNTAGEILWRNGSPVAAYYHADSGGHTENAQALWGAAAPSWMEGRADPYSNQPKPFHWSTQLQKTEIARALGAEGLAVPAHPSVVVLTRTRSGRVARLSVGGREMPAADFRFAIGRQLGWGRLASDLYDILDDGEFVHFDGKGNGRGVGLSQKGAEAMARQGAGYRQILAFYFPSAKTGIGAHDISWRIVRTERLRFLFAEGAEDQDFISMAGRELNHLEALTNYRLRNGWTIRVYPSLALYRDFTGLGGETAAATGRHEIQFQPLAILRARGSLAATVRHELAHALLLDQSSQPLPEWLHEALARYLSGTQIPHTAASERCGDIVWFEDLERGMAQDGEAQRNAALAADAFIDLAIKRLGRDVVLGWPRTGFPGDHDEVLRRLLRQACHK
ncbi:MAG: SpoIID/LytB domain-containing protein [Bryobacterales bacterium]|nr:SpoIID/LytB domain-containing protein [Bryobacterales bacterium]